MSHLPHAVVAILVVFHRSILGWVFSLLLRLGLTAGLIGIKVKSLRSPTGLNKDGSQASRDRVEIRFHPIPLVLGRRVIFRNRGFCKLRQVMEEDGNSGSKGVDKGSRVKSVTVVRIRECRVGSVRLCACPSLPCKNSAKDSGRKALFALTIGELSLEASVNIGVDGTSLSGRDKSKGGDECRSIEENHHLDMMVNAFFEVKCLQVAMIPMHRVHSWLGRPGSNVVLLRQSLGKNSFHIFSKVFSALIPFVQLSGCKLAANVNVLDQDPFSASVSLAEVCLKGSQDLSSSKMDSSNTSISLRDGSGIHLDIGSAKFEVYNESCIGTIEPHKEPSASLRSMNVSISMMQSRSIKNSAVFVQVNQNNNSSAEAIDLSANMSLRSLSSMAVAASGAKDLFGIQGTMQKIRLLRKQNRGCNYKARKRRRNLPMIGQVSLASRFRLSIHDDVALDRHAEVFRVATDLSMRYCERDAGNGPSQSVQIQTTNLHGEHSVEHSPKIERNLLVVKDIDVHYHLMENLIESKIGSFKCFVEDGQVCSVARVAQALKAKPRGFVSSYLSRLKQKKLSSSLNRGKPRVNASFEEVEALFEGYATDDGALRSQVSYRLVSRDLSLGFSPASSSPSGTDTQKRNDRDIIEMKASGAFVFATLHPSLTLPTYIEDGRGDQSSCPVVFALSTSAVSLRVAIESDDNHHHSMMDENARNSGRPQEEIDIFAETLVLREGFEDLLPKDCDDNDSKSTIIVDASKVAVVVLTTKHNDGKKRLVSRDVTISSQGPALNVTWSSVLQLFLLLATKTSENIMKRYLAMFKNRKKKATEVTNVAIDISQSLLNVRVHLGEKTVLDLLSRTCSVSVTNNPEGLWKKPTLQIAASGVSGYLNDFKQQIFSIDELNFDDIIRKASTYEISTYKNNIDPEVAYSQDITRRRSQEYRDSLVSDVNGCPLMEDVGLLLGGHTEFKLPPVLHLGEVIDDFTVTTKALFTALRQAHLMKQKSAEQYQLMSISAVFSFVDASLLEPMQRSIDSYRESRREKFDCFDMMKLNIEDLALSVNRLTPPSFSNMYLNTLDEDNSRVHNYGPVLQGGDTTLTIRQIVCTLHPLTLATPMVALSDFEYSGLFMIGNLHPDTEGLVQRQPVPFLFNCHHKSVDELSSESCATASLDPCGCRYGLMLQSSSAQPKVFFDGKISCRALDGSYGMVVLESLPKFLDIIRRLTPPPPPNSPPSRPIGWWDNLRFLIRGNIGIQVEELCYRFLLDSPARHDWSIALQSFDTGIEYETGAINVVMCDATLTVPGLSYHEACVNNKASDDAVLKLYGIDSTGGRHSLLLVPRLEVKLSFDWIMRHPERSASSEHHIPYITYGGDSFDDSISNAIAEDKYYLFRTHGVHLSLSIRLDTTSSFHNWLTLRSDVLPWLTHKVLSAIPPSSESESDGPGSLPKIESLVLQGEATGIHLCCWFDDDGERQKAASFEQTDGICFVIPSVQCLSETTATGTTQIGINGPVKAALLDMDFYAVGNDDVNRDGGLGETNSYLEECEIMLGCLGENLNGNEMKSCRASKPNSHAFWRNSWGTAPDGREVWTNTRIADPMFQRLQAWSRNISELDSVLTIERVDILTTPLEDILERDRGRSFDDAVQDAIQAGADDHSCATSIASDGGKRPLWHEAQQPWTVLVGGLHILWTLEIRDALHFIIRDLMFTLDYMKLHIRETRPSLLGDNESGEASAEPYFDPVGKDYEKEGLSGDDVAEHLQCKSSLSYLLEERNAVAPQGDSPTKVVRPAVQRGTSQRNETPKPISKMPTIDIHLSNPQIMLHSETTGLSLVLAMHGLYVEGERFLNLVDPDNGVSQFPSPKNLLQKTEFRYKLDCMKIYAVTPGNDVDGGLQWLRRTLDPPRQSAPSHFADESGISQRRFLPQFSHYDTKPFQAQPRLSLIMRESTFQTRQIFHRHPHHLSREEILDYMDQGFIQPLLDESMDQVDLDIDEMSFMLDAQQYVATFDLIRNVFLAPPKQSAKREQRLFADHHETSAEAEKIDMLPPPLGEGEADGKLAAVLREWNLHPRHGKRIRRNLRSASRELMSHLEQQNVLSGNKCNRRIKYTLGKLKWQINSPAFEDKVTIDFTGFRGKHEFAIDGAVESNISLEDVRISSENLGLEAVGFFDPTIILACEVQGDNPCARCGIPLNHSLNNASSCRFHPGKFRISSAASIEEGLWTCCGSTSRDSLGCVAQPHAAREKAAVIRVESLPSPVEGMKLFKHLSIEFYPNVNHNLIFKAHKELANLIMAYFLGGDGNDELDGDDSDDEEESSNRADEPTTHSEQSVDSLPSRTEASVSSPTKRSRKGSRKRRFLAGRRRGRNDTKSSDPSSKGGSHASRSLSVRRRTTSSSHNDGNGAEEHRKPQELTFIKFWRVGHIHSSISVSGFPVETHNLGILIPAFSRAYKAGSTSYFGRKFISHLVHQVVRSAASSGFQKMRGRMLFQPYSRNRANTDFWEDDERDASNAEQNSLELARATLLYGSDQNSQMRKASASGGLRKRTFTR